MSANSFWYFSDLWLKRLQKFMEEFESELDEKIRFLYVYDDNLWFPCNAWCVHKQ